MGKLGLLFLLSSFCSVLTAQIKVIDVDKPIVIGTVKDGSSVRAEISYLIYKSDTVYTLLYNNAEYKVIDNYHTVKFLGQKTLEQFYELCQKTILDGKEVNILLGDSKVSLNPKGKNVYFFTKDGYFFLSRNQIDRLFNKD
jgi:hypothetical protein